MEKNEKSSERFVLIEVPTQMGVAIQDNSNGTTIPENQILVEILNKLERIEKAVG